jgi:hypothetical protein
VVNTRLSAIDIAINAEEDKQVPIPVGGDSVPGVGTSHGEAHPTIASARTQSTTRPKNSKRSVESASQRAASPAPP